MAHTAHWAERVSGTWRTPTSRSCPGLGLTRIRRQTTLGSPSLPPLRHSGVPLGSRWMEPANRQWDRICGCRYKVCISARLGFWDDPSIGGAYFSMPNTGPRWVAAGTQGFSPIFEGEGEMGCQALVPRQGTPRTRDELHGGATLEWGFSPPLRAAQERADHHKQGEGVREWG